MNSRVSAFPQLAAESCPILTLFCSWTPSGLDARMQFALSLLVKKREGEKTKTLGEYKALGAKVMFHVQKDSHE